MASGTGPSYRIAKHLRRGDVVVGLEVDRLSRSLIDLLRILDKMIRSLTEHVDTTTSAGRLMMSMLGSFAQFERDIIRERTKLGLACARANGNGWRQAQAI